MSDQLTPKARYSAGSSVPAGRYRPLTPYCCNITSDTRIAYGSRVSRQGRSRPDCAYQERSSASTRAA